MADTAVQESKDSHEDAEPVLDKIAVKEAEKQRKAAEKEAVRAAKELEKLRKTTFKEWAKALKAKDLDGLRAAVRACTHREFMVVGGGLDALVKQLGAKDPACVAVAIAQLEHFLWPAEEYRSDPGSDREVLAPPRERDDAVAVLRAARELGKWPGMECLTRRFGDADEAVAQSALRLWRALLVALTSLPFGSAEREELLAFLVASEDAPVLALGNLVLDFARQQAVEKLQRKLHETPLVPRSVTPLVASEALACLRVVVSEAVSPAYAPDRKWQHSALGMLPMKQSVEAMGWKAGCADEPVLDAPVVSERSEGGVSAQTLLQLGAGTWGSSRHCDDVTLLGLLPGAHGASSVHVDPLALARAVAPGHSLRRSVVDALDQTGREPHQIEFARQQDKAAAARGSPADTVSTVFDALTFLLYHHTVPLATAARDLAVEAALKREAVTSSRACRQHASAIVRDLSWAPSLCVRLLEANVLGAAAQAVEASTLDRALALKAIGTANAAGVSSSDEAQRRAAGADVACLSVGPFGPAALSSSDGEEEPAVENSAAPRETPRLWEAGDPMAAGAIDASCRERAEAEATAAIAAQQHAATVEKAPYRWTDGTWETCGKSPSDAALLGRSGADVALLEGERMLLQANSSLEDLCDALSRILRQPGAWHGALQGQFLAESASSDALIRGAHDAERDRELAELEEQAIAAGKKPKKHVLSPEQDAEREDLIRGEQESARTALRAERSSVWEAVARRDLVRVAASVGGATLLLQGIVRACEGIPVSRDETVLPSFQRSGMALFGVLRLLGGVTRQPGFPSLEKDWGVSRSCIVSAIGSSGCFSALAACLADPTCSEIVRNNAELTMHQLSLEAAVGSPETGLARSASAVDEPWDCAAAAGTLWLSREHDGQVVDVEQTDVEVTSVSRSAPTTELLERSKEALLNGSDEFALAGGKATPLPQLEPSQEGGGWNHPACMQRLVSSKRLFEADPVHDDALAELEALERAESASAADWKARPVEVEKTDKGGKPKGGKPAKDAKPAASEEGDVAAFARTAFEWRSSSEYRPSKSVRDSQATGNWTQLPECACSVHGPFLGPVDAARLLSRGSPDETTVAPWSLSVSWMLAVAGCLRRIAGQVLSSDCPLAQDTLQHPLIASSKLPGVAPPKAEEGSISPGYCSDVAALLSQRLALHQSSLEGEAARDVGVGRMVDEVVFGCCRLEAPFLGWTSDAAAMTVPASVMIARMEAARAAAAEEAAKTDAAASGKKGGAAAKGKAKGKDAKKKDAADTEDLSGALVSQAVSDALNRWYAGRVWVEGWDIASHVWKVLPPPAEGAADAKPAKGGAPAPKGGEVPVTEAGDGVLDKPSRSTSLSGASIRLGPKRRALPSDDDESDSNVRGARLVGLFLASSDSARGDLVARAGLVPLLVRLVARLAAEIVKGSEPSAAVQEGAACALQCLVRLARTSVTSLAAMSELTPLAAEAVAVLALRHHTVSGFPDGRLSGRNVQAPVTHAHVPSMSTPLLHQTTVDLGVLACAWVCAVAEADVLARVHLEAFEESHDANETEELNNDAKDPGQLENRHAMELSDKDSWSPCHRLALAFVRLLPALSMSSSRSDVPEAVKDHALPWINSSAYATALLVAQAALWQVPGAKWAVLASLLRQQDKAWRDRASARYAEATEELQRLLEGGGDDKAVVALRARLSSPLVELDSWDDDSWRYGLQVLPTVKDASPRWLATAWTMLGRAPRGKNVLGEDIGVTQPRAALSSPEEAKPAKGGAKHAKGEEPSGEAVASGLSSDRESVAAACSARELDWCQQLPLSGFAKEGDEEHAGGKKAAKDKKPAKGKKDAPAAEEDDGLLPVANAHPGLSPFRLPNAFALLNEDEALAAPVEFSGVIVREMILSGPRAVATPRLPPLPEGSEAKPVGEMPPKEARWKAALAQVSQARVVVVSQLLQQLLEPTLSRLEYAPRVAEESELVSSVLLLSSLATDLSRAPGEQTLVSSLAAAQALRGGGLVHLASLALAFPPIYGDVENPVRPDEGAEVAREALEGVLGAGSTHLAGFRECPRTNVAGHVDGWCGARGSALCELDLSARERLGAVGRSLLKSLCVRGRAFAGHQRAFSEWAIPDKGEADEGASGKKKAGGKGKDAPPPEEPKAPVCVLVRKFVHPRGGELAGPSASDWAVLLRVQAHVHRFSESLVDVGSFHSAPGRQAWVPSTLTALHVAAEVGDEEFIEALCISGAEVNARDTRWRIPAASAMDNGHPNAAMLLVRMGSDLRAVDAEGNPLLKHAVVSPWASEAKAFALDAESSSLLRVGADAFGPEALASAAALPFERGHAGTRGDGPPRAVAAPWDEGGEDAHHEAARQIQSVARARAAREHAGSIAEARTTSGRPAVLHAASSSVDLVQRLLELGCDPHQCDAKGQTCLHWLAGGGAVRARTASLRTRLETSKDESVICATMAACIVHGATIDAADITGRTALCTALLHGRIATSLMLLASGASPALTDRTGAHALHYACLGNGWRAFGDQCEQLSWELVEAAATGASKASAYAAAKLKPRPLSFGRHTPDEDEVASASGAPSPAGDLVQQWASDGPAGLARALLERSAGLAIKPAEVLVRSCPEAYGPKSAANSQPEVDRALLRSRLRRTLQSSVSAPSITSRPCTASEMANHLSKHGVRPLHVLAGSGVHGESIVSAGIGSNSVHTTGGGLHGRAPPAVGVPGLKRVPPSGEPVTPEWIASVFEDAAGAALARGEMLLALAPTLDVSSRGCFGIGALHTWAAGLFAPVETVRECVSLADDTAVAAAASPAKRSGFGPLGGERKRVPSEALEAALATGGDPEAWPPRLVVPTLATSEVDRMLAKPSAVRPYLVACRSLLQRFVQAAGGAKALSEVDSQSLAGSGGRRYGPIHTALEQAQLTRDNAAYQRLDDALGLPDREVGVWMLLEADVSVHPATCNPPTIHMAARAGVSLRLFEAIISAQAAEARAVARWKRSAMDEFETARDSYILQNGDQRSFLKSAASPAASRVMTAKPVTVSWGEIDSSGIPGRPGQGEQRHAGTMLQEAAQAGRTELVKWILSNAPRAPQLTGSASRSTLGSGFHAPGSPTPRHDEGASQPSSEPTASGLDLNAVRPHSGRTAMHLAAFNGHAEIVRLLVRAGASECIRDNWGETPLTSAVRGRSAECVEAVLLTKSPIPVTEILTANDRGDTPLSVAEALVEQAAVGSSEHERSQAVLRVLTKLLSTTGGAPQSPSSP
jgi:ankyrin repeat protein